MLTALPGDFMLQTAEIMRGNALTIAVENLAREVAQPLGYLSLNWHNHAPAIASSSSWSDVR
jgi:hypothetical protein